MILIVDDQKDIGTGLERLLRYAGHESVSVTGGAEALAQRAAGLAAAGQTRLAAHLIEFASTAQPANAAIQAIRTRVYAQCVDKETSLIGKAIFAVYQRDAAARSSPS